MALLDTNLSKSKLLADGPTTAELDRKGNHAGDAHDRTTLAEAQEYLRCQGVQVLGWRLLSHRQMRIRIGKAASVWWGVWESGNNAASQR